MQFHELPCLFCGRKPQVLHKGKDDPATFPCIAGGVVNINFGYGSEFDSLSDHIVHQGLICDSCFHSAKTHVRTMKEITTKRWEQI